MEYKGYFEDIRFNLSQTDCIILPSFYKEGTPKILLEAGAMGVPIITTKMPGCEDTVDDGVTGFLCKPQSSTDLADKISQFISMSPKERNTMGKKCQNLIKSSFDEKFVIKKYLLSLKL